MPLIPLSRRSLVMVALAWPGQCAAPSGGAVTATAGVRPGSGGKPVRHLRVVRAGASGRNGRPGCCRRRSAAGWFGRTRRPPSRPSARTPSETGQGRDSSFLTQGSRDRGPGEALPAGVQLVEMKQRQLPRVKRSQRGGRMSTVVVPAARAAPSHALTTRLSTRSWIPHTRQMKFQVVSSSGVNHLSGVVRNGEIPRSGIVRPCRDNLATISSVHRPGWRKALSRRANDPSGRRSATTYASSQGLSGSRWCVPRPVQMTRTARPG